MQAAMDDDDEEEDYEEHSGAGGKQHGNGLDQSEYPSDSDIPGYKSLPVSGSSGGQGSGSGRGVGGAAGGQGGATAKGASGPGMGMLGMDTSGGVPGASPASAPGVYGIPPAKLAYDPSEYARLAAGKGVSDELREILGYIAAFNPTPVELPTPLKPFVPDYIPALSEVRTLLGLLYPVLAVCDHLDHSGHGYGRPTLGVGKHTAAHTL